MTPLVTLELSLQDAETLGSTDPAVRAYIDLAIARVMRGSILPNVEAANVEPDFPTDLAGRSLAWPEPNGTGYVDAWNGWYATRDEALRESTFWTARLSERTRQYGEGLSSEYGAVDGPEFYDDATREYDRERPGADGCYDKPDTLHAWEWRDRFASVRRMFDATDQDPT